jgi:hypothetical protein
MELPSTHVGVEDRPSPRGRLLRRDETLGTYPHHRPLHVSTH